MANRSAAEIFSIAFKACAEQLDPPDDPATSRVRSVARTLWWAQQDYDFTEDQMGCDEALFKLGFAKKVKETTPGYEHEEYTGYLKSDGDYR